MAWTMDATGRPGDCMPNPPADISISVDQSPPPVQLLLLGLQYAFLLCVYLIIVVMVVRAAGVDAETGRSVVSMAMLASAVGTILQALPRGPVGSGFLAPPVFSAIYLGPSLLAAKAGGLPAVACMTICAALTEIAVGRILHRLPIITQPTISGLTICIVALELGIVGLRHALDVAGERQPLFAAQVFAAAVTFAVAVGFTVWGKGVWKLVCSLLGMTAGTGVAFAVGLFDAAAGQTGAAAPWLALPNPSYMGLHWEAGLLPAFLAAGVAAAIRTVGVVSTCQKANDASWTRPDFINLRKGIYADGLGCAIGGLVGAPGMNIAPSLVGVSIVTGVTSRAVAWVAAAVLVALAFIPKVADVFLQLPLSVAGGLLVFTASIMLASGLQLMLARPLDVRFTFVVALGLLFPLVAISTPDYFSTLPKWIALLTNSTLALGLSAAITLLLVFRIGSARERTMIWSSSQEALSGLQSLLTRSAADWNLSRSMIDRGIAGTRTAIELLNDGHLLREPVAILARQRENTFEIELTYQGVPVHLPDLATRPPTHEEHAAVAGLQDVGLAVLPDRSSTISHNGQTTLRLGFDV